MRNLRHKFFITVLVSSAAIAACFILILIPAEIALKEAFLESQSQGNFLESIGKRGENLDYIKKEWEDSDKKLKRIDERIVADDEMVDLVMLLENLAENFSCEQEMSVLRQEGSSEAILLKNNISGDFNSMMRYVKSVENAKYLIEIDECSFSKKSGKISGELLLRVPVYKAD